MHEVTVFDWETAKLLQLHLARLVAVEPLDLDRLEAVFALDVGYRGSRGVGVAVAYSAKSRRELCHVAVSHDVYVPYVPGLLAFREAPLMIAAAEELSARCLEPDLLMVNGHGLAHPRRCGIASHIGVVLDRPSVGVAKRMLYGSIAVEGARKAIVVEGARVGYVVEKGGKRVFVSVGHRVTAEDALAVVDMLWSGLTPLPEPLHIADSITKRLRGSL